MMGDVVQSMCTPSEPYEEPGHARLQRMIEERERQEAEKKKKAAELRELEAKCTAQWQVELEAMGSRREGMTNEELEQDCLAHFATFELLVNSAEGSPISQQPDMDEGCDDDMEAQSGYDSEQALEELREPDGAYEIWLDQRLCVDGLVADDSARMYRSVGELPTSACAGLTKTLVQALQDSAGEIEKALAGGHSYDFEQEQFDDKLDRLVEKYVDEPLDNGVPCFSRRTSVCTDPMTAAAEAAAAAGQRRRGGRHRAVGERLDALLPCLEGDVISERLATALAALDAGSGAEAAPERAGQDFRAASRAFSTADACWALRSEKRALLVERLLPGAEAESGRWYWPQVRKTCVGYWLCGPDSQAALETVVQKCVQTAVMRARDRDRFDGASKRAVDEAIFWYTLRDTNSGKLAALLRTGAIGYDPRLEELLEKKNSPEVLRKNAFRLLQLHRYHLAAALFLIGGFREEAVRVVAGHLQDLQLTLLVARRNMAAVAPLLLERLRESPLAQRDPWLRFLLAHRASEDPSSREAAISAARAAIAADSPTRQVCASGEEGCGDNVSGATTFDMSPPLFDGVLRLAASCEGLAEVGFS